MSIDLKAFAITELEQARDFFLKDLAVLPDAALAESPGGAARSPYHFMYEMVCVNNRLATRMRGVEPGPFDPNMWAVTPPEFQSRPVAVQQLTDSIDSMLNTFKSFSKEEIHKSIATPNGSTSPFDLTMFCAKHTMYHDAQLNYIQALRGDAEMHWQD